MNIIITGASSGIGKALAVVYARNGHEVLTVARRESLLIALRQELEQKYGVLINYLAMDITAPAAPQTIFQEAVQRFGKVHVLINNAGMSPYQDFRDLHYSHICQILALNIRSLTELCYLFIPHMLNHGEPSRVLNVSSVGGYAPLPKFSVYSGSKHYVRVFTNMLNYEYQQTNLRVCGLYPGGTLTEFPVLAGQRIKPIARKAMMTPEQVAEMAYPLIMKGKRVIIPGTLNKLAVFVGKLFPFPLNIHLMDQIYSHGIEPIPPTYPI
jgi:uncharacterized protein